MRAVAPLVFLALLASSAGAQAPLSIPAPRGHVNDFASVIPAEEAQEMERLARFVREKSGGDIAIVTLPDLGGRDPAQVALQIGREWKVGAKAEVGDARRNAGVVVLLIPRETSSDGRGYIRIEVGNGAEGFITDAAAGRMRDEATPYFRERRYGAGLYVITGRLAQSFAREFQFSLDEVGVATPQASRRGARGMNPVTAAIVFLLLVAFFMGAGRGGCAPFIVGQILGNAMGRRSRHHGWGGGGFGGGWGGGGGGGGFGGFGGGGGFSGGGSGGSF